MTCAMTISPSIVLVGLYSDDYPALGESHGISALAGYLTYVCRVEVEIIDMVAHGRQLTDYVVGRCTDLQPKLIGLSVAYGTYDYALDLWKKLNSICPNARFVFGGPLATFLASEMIKATSQKSIVVVGEGEESLAALAMLDAENQELDAICNLVFVNQKGELTRTFRKSVDLTVYFLPIRDVPSSGQVYTEGSRGCSWANCTFCLRGLLDIAGRGEEHRYFPIERIVNDVKRLVSSGFRSITFADEDILGGSKQSAAYIREVLVQLATNSEVPITFDASFTVHSIFSSRMNDEDVLFRKDILLDLKKAGLRKAFLGIESASRTQLKRYAKYHTKEEITVAVNLIKEIGLELELGWIPFDPLCTIDELLENFSFLTDEGIAPAVSYMFNELRLQPGTSYLNLLRVYESRNRRVLHNENIIRNTLSFQYDYQSTIVGDLVYMLRKIAPRIRKVHYPLKNLTRYGAQGALGDNITMGRKLLTELRLALCASLVIGLQSAREEEIASLTRVSIENTLHRIGKELLAWLNQVPSTNESSEILKKLRSDVASELRA